MYAALLREAEELDRQYAEAAAFDKQQKAKWLTEVIERHDREHPKGTGCGCLDFLEEEDEMWLLHKAALSNGQP